MALCGALLNYDDLNHDDLNHDDYNHHDYNHHDRTANHDDHCSGWLSFGGA